MIIAMVGGSAMIFLYPSQPLIGISFEGIFVGAGLVFWEADWRHRYAVKESKQLADLDTKLARIIDLLEHKESA